MTLWSEFRLIYFLSADIYRRSCSIFQLKQGTYDTKRFAEKERGLSDAALARNMRVSARELQEEEKISKRKAKEEDRREALLGAKSVTYHALDSDDSD